MIELVKALREQGSLAPRQGRADVADLSLPQTLPLTILRRVSNLAPQTLQVLRVAAVLGREFSMAELSMVTGRSAVALLPELDGALRAGLLAESAMGLVFRHELIREAIYHDVAPVLRQGLHREVARVLTAAGAPVGRVADHLYVGASAADPEARRWLRRAASEAAPRSLAVAVKLCERAFQLTSADDPDRAAVAAELAPLLLQTGRPKDAEQIAREVLARGPRAAHEVVLRRALGEVLWAIGWLEPAVAELEAVARVPGAPDRDRAGSLALAANIRIFLGDPHGARDQAQRARTLEPDDDFTGCLAAQTLALAAHASGELAEALQLAQRAVEIAARSRDPRVGHLHPHLHLGMALLDADRRDEAAATLQLGRQLSEERGNVMWLPLHHAMLAMHRVMSGELTDALAEAEAGLVLADEVGTRLHAPLLHGVAAWVALQQGDIAAGAARMSDAEAEFIASVSQDWQLTALADGIRMAGARAAEAIPVLDHALDFYLRTGTQRGAARVEAALRALGVRRRRAGHAPRPSMGWESLTDGELGVARLAAEGLTNRQIGDRLFISRRTVGTHLTHIFQKLGINTRTQLARRHIQR